MLLKPNYLGWAQKASLYYTNSIKFESRVQAFLIRALCSIPAPPHGKAFIIDRLWPVSLYLHNKVG